MEINSLPKKEKTLSTLSHILGIILGIIFFCLLIFPSISEGSTTKIVAFSIYAGTFLLVFLNSALYNIISNEKIKHFFSMLDNSSIYFFIAASYTPIILVLIDGFLKYFLLITVWALAILGIIFKFIDSKKNAKTRWIAIALYVIMGWLAILFVSQMLNHSNIGFIILFVLGFLVYSIGTFFFKKESRPYSNVLWHIFVLAAGIIHFITFYIYLV